MSKTIIAFLIIAQIRDPTTQEVEVNKHSGCLFYKNFCFHFRS